MYRDAALADGGFDLAPAVLDKLRSRRLHLAVAESCTGGALGAALFAHQIAAKRQISL